MAKKEIKKSKILKKEFGNGFGIAGFILGLISILTFGGLLILPLLGLIFSIIQMRKKRTGYAIAGLVLNIVSMLIFILIIYVWIILNRFISSA